MCGLELLIVGLFLFVLAGPAALALYTNIRIAHRVLKSTVCRYNTWASKICSIGGTALEVINAFNPGGVTVTAEARFANYDKVSESSFYSVNDGVVTGAPLVLEGGGMTTLNTFYTIFGTVRANRPYTVYGFFLCVQSNTQAMIRVEGSDGFFLEKFCDSSVLASLNGCILSVPGAAEGVIHTITLYLYEGNNIVQTWELEKEIQEPLF